MKETLFRNHSSFHPRIAIYRMFCHNDSRWPCHKCPSKSHYAITFIHAFWGSWCSIYYQYIIYLVCLCCITWEACISYLLVLSGPISKIVTLSHHCLPQTYEDTQSAPIIFTLSHHNWVWRTTYLHFALIDGLIQSWSTNELMDHLCSPIQSGEDLLDGKCQWFVIFMG